MTNFATEQDLARQLANHSASINEALTTVVQQVSRLAAQFSRQNDLVNQAIDAIVERAMEETAAQGRGDWHEVQKTVDCMLAADLNVGAPAEPPHRPTSGITRRPRIAGPLGRGHKPVAAGSAARIRTATGDGAGSES
jgi:hypothetical protein